MKKLEAILSNCQDCPYLIYAKEWLCGHDDAEGDIRINSIAEDFPKWCPLENCDPGVKVGLTAMIIRDGKILLGKRINTETAAGMLAYPGGRMDYGEDPEDGVIREVFEETGLVIKKGTMNYLTFKNEYFPEAKKHYVSLVFIASEFEGEPEVKEPDKCGGWDWYDPFNLPENTFWAIKETIAANLLYIQTFIAAKKK